ncbi:YjbH domain-containing protein [Tritonibacter mobilis]|uniref:YjbH domain-containing protein n=1 Tax=Tritonibacter mobilis TaxID=379347 RepID=UPI001403DA04|nr:YjbH domain-containing protein [Tritonibacter mobilis]NHM20240.1 YjbH domain-containing protein [Tritonibacter mobilis]NHM24404.1 YjbH domain-containing protein [Tritonibacter mobilis]
MSEFVVDVINTMADRDAMNSCGCPLFTIRLLICACTMAPISAVADSKVATSYNSYGYPGLIDMPVATSRPDGELALTTSSFAGQTRNTLTFQITPRLSGSFRYSILEKDVLTGGVPATNYDRSFSLHYRFMDENPNSLRPTVAIGLNDFLGTGIYSSEYIVATKTIVPRLRFSAGLGWGRLGTSGGFKNPLSVINDRFEIRPARNTGLGGKVESGQFFRGDAALFGGIEWQATERLKFTLEYSSDAYPRESRFAVDRESQLNLGASYKIRPNVDLSLRYMYGSEFGVQLTAALNPKSPPNAGGREPAPPPVLPATSAAAATWAEALASRDSPQNRVSDALAGQGIRLHGFTRQDTTVRAEIENETYLHEAQAIGRSARVLSRLMPADIETFDIVLVTSGMPVSKIRIRRQDMEQLEHEFDGSWKSFARAQIATSVGGTTPIPGRYPRFDWSLKPYLSPSLFDPDDPIRADFGAELAARFEPTTGLVFSGGLRQKILGNLDESTRKSDSVLPHVRSDFNLYDKEDGPTITHLTAAYYFKPGRDVYGRVTTGYLERMYGGLSTELLWKPNDSPFAVGVEANYAKQRDFNQLFGFRDYDVFTGHVSGYWDMGNGFHTQLDVGRYLAGDWGATVSVDREFKNGWRIGAFATLTDVPFSEFGEGSFDKGIRLTIPISWLTGEPNKTGYSTTIRPLSRDGGARLNVGGRLYDRVRPLQKKSLQEGWGKFWR